MFRLKPYIEMSEIDVNLYKMNFTNCEVIQVHSHQFSSYESVHGQCQDLHSFFDFHLNTIKLIK